MLRAFDSPPNSREPDSIERRVPYPRLVKPLLLVISTLVCLVLGVSLYGH
jgi:hypothetical protein